jgi:hypothetical protein
VNDSRSVELLVRDALHDAADHAALVESVPSAGAASRVGAPRRHTRALVAVCVVLVALVATIAAVAFTRDAGKHVRVTTPAAAAREVPVDDIPRQATDVAVYMRIGAIDADVQAVRDVLTASPDVARFSYVDSDAAYRDFASIYACNPGLVRSIQPEDLPVSFRVISTSPEATERLDTSLASASGVESVAVGSDVSPDTDCAATLPATHLPPAGEQPADVTSARDAIVAAFTQAWDGTESVAQRRAAMEDFRDTDQLVAAFDHAHDPTGVTTMRAVVGDIVFVTPERAELLYHLELDGDDGPIDIGGAVLQDGRWKVSRETVCTEAQRVGVACSG